MAKRPVFIPTGNQNHLVDELLIDFEWNPGFSPSQKKKNVLSLHESAKKASLFPLLEISTKSNEILGRKLSAFSLKLTTSIGEISLESAYQGSKVFEKSGPYTDIYNKNSFAAKADERIRKSGKLTRFEYFGQKWPLVPKTAFYDWLYLSALRPYQDYLKRLYKYEGFTDIEFNPRKSINCQARSCALLVSLLRLGLLEQALKSQQNFREMTSSKAVEKNHFAESHQGSLAV